MHPADTDQAQARPPTEHLKPSGDCHPIEQNWLILANRLRSLAILLRFENYKVLVLEILNEAPAVDQKQIIRGHFLLHYT